MYYKDLKSEDRFIDGIHVGLIATAGKMVATDLQQYTIVVNQVLIDAIQSEKPKYPFSEVQKILQDTFGCNPVLNTSDDFDFTQFSTKLKTDLNGNLYTTNPLIQNKNIRNYVDIKEFDTPNICFSLTESNYKRELEFKEQRITRGFDDSETCALDCTIANFIIPRLERYLEVAPKLINLDLYIDDMKLLLSAMKLIVRDDGFKDFTDEENKIVESGLSVFPKIFLRLGW